MNIVCFGDSNTWGYDPQDVFADAYKNNWCSVLAEISGHSIRNLGENGRRIPKTTLLPGSIDLLTVMLGTNDLLQGLSAEVVCEKMEQFLKNLPLSPKKILLIAPPPMKLGAWVPNQHLVLESNRLTGGYRILAKKLGVHFAAADGWNIPIAFDGVHFTEDGHRAFAYCLFGCIETILPSKSI